MRDCSHLATHSLGLGSPYPILPKHVEAMARVIDPSVTPDRTSPLAEAMLSAFGNKKIGGALFASGFGSDGGIREGHRDRVVRTPGVISTRSSSVDCDLSFKERKLTTKVPQIVIDKLRDARSGIRPDGEELVEAMEVSMCCRHVGCGYYHCWVFPRSTEEDRAKGGTIDQWYAARKAFNKELRAKVLRGEPDLDSRKLCEDAARRAWMSPPYDGDRPIWPAINWPEWAAIEDAVYYEARTKWIDDFIAQDAAAWARESRGIVWVECNELGQRIAELAGVNFHHGGPNAEELLAAEDGSRSIVTTIKANGESTDGLQLKFYRQLVVEPPSSGDRWEQLLGRLVRQGQVEDEVETEIYLHTSEMRDALHSAYMLAQFIEQTTPNRQLLLAADGIEDLV